LRLLAAVGKITVPVLPIHTTNDYSVAPGKALAAEFARLSKPHVLKMYPPVGQITSDGHNFLYKDVALWEGDVFGFLVTRLPDVFQGALPKSYGTVVKGVSLVYSVVCFSGISPLLQGCYF
jgi:hypothetical protein